MTDLDQILEVGTILLLEQGCYSDKSWHGPFRILKNVTKRQLVDGFEKQWVNPDPGWYNQPDPSEFIAWITRSGYAEDVEKSHRWHIGEYGSFSP